MGNKKSLREFDGRRSTATTAALGWCIVLGQQGNAPIAATIWSLLNSARWQATYRPRPPSSSLATADVAAGRSD